MRGLPSREASAAPGLREPSLGLRGVLDSSVPALTWLVSILVLHSMAQCLVSWHGVKTHFCSSTGSRALPLCDIYAALILSSHDFPV